jgi:hypothetical protein
MVMSFGREKIKRGKLKKVERREIKGKLKL